MRNTPAIALAPNPGGRSEFARNWPLVVTCMAGMSISGIGVYTLGQFMAPLEGAFGWTRTQSSGGLAFALVIGFLLSPIVGRAVDVMSIRLLAILGLILSGVTLAALSLASRDLNLWFVLWGLEALGVALTGPTVWTAMVASRFTANRSFALALTLCGASISAGFAPPVARYLIDTVGWRHTYQLLGLCWCGAVLLLVVFFGADRDRPVAAGVRKASRSGVRLRAVFLSPTFLKLVVVVFVVMSAMSAYGIHLAPALVDKGFDRRQAANIAGVEAIGLIAGKLCVGWFFDRAPLNVVTTAIMLTLATACGLLGVLDGQVPLALTASIVLGLSAGAMLTVMACVTARYFRAEDFGVVFGVLAGAMGLGSAAGPMTASAIHDQTGSYTPGFWAGIGVALGSALILRSLAPVGVSPDSRIGDGGVKEESLMV